MNIQLRFIGMPRVQTVEHHTKRRIHFALDRWAPSIRGVSVAFTDENGPRGGVDQRCTTHVYLRTGGRPLVVRAVAESPGLAVAKTLERVRRRLERRVLPPVAAAG